MLIDDFWFRRVEYGVVTRYYDQVAGNTQGHALGVFVPKSGHDRQQLEADLTTAMMHEE